MRILGVVVRVLVGGGTGGRARVQEGLELSANDLLMTIPKIESDHQRTMTLGTVRRSMRTRER